VSFREILIAVDESPISIVSIRERRAFWTSRPGRLLASALAGDACVGLAIAMFGVGELESLALAPTA
jgi:H+-transporting ATPase